MKKMHFVDFWVNPKFILEMRHCCLRFFRVQKQSKYALKWNSGLAKGFYHHASTSFHDQKSKNSQFRCIWKFNHEKMKKCIFWRLNEPSKFWQWNITVLFSLSYKTNLNKFSNEILDLPNDFSTMSGRLLNTQKH